MRILLYFLLLGLALEHVCSIPIARIEDNDKLLEVRSNEEEAGDEVENEEETVEESGSGSGSKRNLIEEEVKEDDETPEGESDEAVGKDAITKADDVPDEGDNQEDDTDNQEKESQEEKEETKKPEEEDTSSKTELTKKTEVPSMEDEDEQVEQTQDEPPEKENAGEDNLPTESEQPDDDEDEGDNEESGKKRSDLCKRHYGGCEEEGHEEGHEGHGHHHGHHEHEHEHHHHGHHHGFVHEWGEEEGGGHHGHQGHGHHEGHHEHEHEHEHGYGGHEGIGHHGGYGGGGWGGGYGDGGYGGGYGGGCGGGCGGGWGRSQVQQAPPMAFHCRDMVSKDGKKHTKRFCVPIGYNGGYGWPYFHGYPGTGLGQWGWGFPWIKSKVEGSKGVKSKDSKKEAKKVQRDHITKKQTVHVGYGYASGDNYRLGFQAGGMGGLASTFTGHLGPATLPDHFKKSIINKRQFGFGGHGVGPVGAGPVDAPGYGGHSTPYGHPVTHPGFTTMGYPGHALASTDVRSGIQRPKRDVDGYPEAMIPEDNFQVEDPEKEFANYQYYEEQPIENEEHENTFSYNAE